LPVDAPLTWCKIWTSDRAKKWSMALGMYQFLHKNWSDTDCDWDKIRSNLHIFPLRFFHFEIQVWGD
jgi:muramidase (phage lysozyme)